VSEYVLHDPNMSFFPFVGCLTKLFQYLDHIASHDRAVWKGLVLFRHLPRGAEPCVPAEMRTEHHSITRLRVLPLTGQVSAEDLISILMFSLRRI
jgi:hypothetical protein